MNNYTTGKALSLFNTSTEYTCTVNTLPVNFLFQPSSDNASVYIGHQFRYNETSSVSFSGSGYWSGGANSPTSAAFNSFGPGEYTVLGADEWGNVLILHFTVSNA